MTWFISISFGVVGCLLIWLLLRHVRRTSVSRTDALLLEAWALKSELAAIQLSTSNDGELVFAVEGRIQRHKVTSAAVPEVASILLVQYQGRLSPGAERLAMKALVSVSADEKKLLYSTVLDLLKSN